MKSLKNVSQEIEDKEDVTMKILKNVAREIENRENAKHLGWCLLSALDRAVKEGCCTIRGLTRFLRDEAGITGEISPRDFDD